MAKKKPVLSRRPAKKLKKRGELLTKAKARTAPPGGNHRSWADQLRLSDPELMDEIDELVDLFLKGELVNQFRGFRDLRDWLATEGYIPENVKREAFRTYVSKREETVKRKTK